MFGRATPSLHSSCYGPPMNATCPACDANISLSSDAVEGEIISCSDCGADLQLVDLDPPMLELAPEVAEDWGE